MKIYEEVLWKGKPKKGFQLVTEDLIIIPFLCFFGFALYIISRGKLPLLIFFGFIFINLIYVRYIRDIIERKHTEYYITPTKIIIKTRKHISEIYFKSIKDISWKDHPFNFKYGSIIFGKEENIFGDPNRKFIFGAHYGLNLSRDKLSIAFIKDFKEVYNMINDRINNSSKY